MTRVYFRMGNRMKSRLYDANDVVNDQGTLEIYKNTTVVIKEDPPAKKRWWHGPPREDAFVRREWIATWAKGEWVRVEQEPEPKEKKSEDPVRA
jgi:hypothetical protein